MLIRGLYTVKLWRAITEHSPSACGIPDNALDQNKAAIHPYWLKYAGLDRKSSEQRSLDDNKC